MKSLSRNEWIGISASLVFISYAMFGEIITNSFRQNVSEDTAALVAPNFDNNIPQNMTEVDTKDIVLGSGTSIAPGMIVDVHYVLKLSDGTLIQDSKVVNNGMPFSFIYGAGQVIPGWEMGIAGMKVGGKRVITIPPSLGYGAQDVGPIPANSTLIFEIEVVSARPLTE